MNYLHTNQLINSTSPYLLQHAHNPVNWNPWSENIVERAKNKDKLLLVSIGYAACHWCHVMEHESFENEQVARIMNDNFICIKVDREERPDIDHYYMTAVQLMQQQGGWPLNVIALPDGRPIWGGTYFPKVNWMKNLQTIADFYRKNRLQTEEYASRLQNGIEQASLIISSKEETGIDFQMLENAVNRWKKSFDLENGGRIGAPKFPMPVNLDFLLYYGFMSSDEIFAENHSLTLDQLQIKVANWKKTLLNVRSKRVRPGLDDKTLISWNALVIQGLTDAFIAFGEIRFIELAVRNATFITENILQSDGKLFHSWKQGKSTIDGFLEDYALIIQAYISLFEITGDEKWLQISKKLTDYCFRHFHDEKSGLFYFAEKKSNSVVTNHFQNEDNVIPAANSVMANNLHKLYLILGKPESQVIARQMLQAVIHQFTGYPMAFANWGILMLKITRPFYEVAVTGDNAKETVNEMRVGFYPNVLWVFSNSGNNIPILKNRMKSGKTLIYVCIEGMCKLPVENPKQAIEFIV